MNIVNANFLSRYMTKKHVMLCFGIKGNEVDNLIAEGWLVKYYQYFRPTQQLYEQLCPDEIEIKDMSRINGMDRFGIIDIQLIFNCDQWTARTIANKYFLKTQFGFYKRSDQLNQLLADGETICQLK